MPTDKRTMEEYSSHYQQWLDNKGPVHSMLEKPAMYTALGDVSGKSILCIGCGAGEECEHLRSCGAEVVGIDLSEGLVAKACESYPEIEFHVMDMEQITLERQFDIVYSSLVLHYVKDWTVVFEQVQTALKSDGFFLFSTHNPAYWSGETWETNTERGRALGFTKNKETGELRVYGDYMNPRQVFETWFDDFQVSYYHKPFSAIITEIISSGFRIVECIEPQPIEGLDKYQKLPLFIIFKLHKDYKE
ncbi:MAG: class I SAM-dependent methyltransferase [Nanobdellota archaeon]